MALIDAPFELDDPKKRRPARSTSSMDVYGSDPSGGLVDAPYHFDEPKAAAGAAVEEPKKPSSIISAVKRGTGGVLANLARTGEDVGLPLGGIREYGERLEEENPADVRSLSDIAHHPIQFLKETVGEVAPQIGLSVGGAVAGARTGGALGALVGPEGVPIGAAIGAGVGGFGTSWLQSFGGQRRGQDEKNIDAPGRAALAAGASAGVDLLGPEMLFARRLATTGLKKSALGIVKRPLLTTAWEGGGEGTQEFIEEYGTTGTTFGPDWRQRYGMAVAKGAVAGAGVGTIEQVFGKDKTQNLPEDKPAAVTAPVEPVGGSTEMLALPAPGQRQLPAPERLLPAPNEGPIRGAAPKEPLRLTDQRSPQTRMEAYRNAIGKIESSNNYRARGPVIKNPNSMYYGERAAGRYGIMPGNIPEWSRAALGEEISLNEFLARPDLQDQIFDHRFKDHIRRFGSPEDAASAWLTGKPLRTAGGRADELGTTGQKYAAMFREYGGTTGGAGEGVEATEGEEAETPEIDNTPGGVLRRINEIAGEEDEGHPLAKTLTKAVLKGGDQAATIIGRQRAQLAKDFDELAARKDIIPDEVERKFRALQRRERTIIAAANVAAEMAQARGPKIVTEPGPLPRPLPAEPQENPELAAMGEQYAQEGAMDHANALSARTQMEQAQAAAARPAAEVAAENTRRGKLLARVIALNSADPRADFIEALGDKPLTQAEEDTIA
ncbi:MAG: hypothetical protein EHM24_26265, partial [Acidobacteria bacterium]